MTDALNPNQALALERRRRTMMAIKDGLDGILMEAINSGRPFLASPRWRSMLLQFEASRIRVEAYCVGDHVITNDEATKELKDEN